MTSPPTAVSNPPTAHENDNGTSLSSEPAPYVLPIIITELARRKGGS